MAFTPMRQATPPPANDFQAIKISLASPQQILRWSFGEVTKAETINYRSLRPEKDGLFCERIFGPTRDWECYCGKYKRQRDRQRREGFKCEHCGVEVTRSNVRRERMGHISLAAPVAHIWFSKGTPSRMSLILEITPRNLERVLYFSSYVITKVDEEARENAIAELEAYREQEWERLSDLRAQESLAGNAEEYLSQLIEETVRLQIELGLEQDEMPSAPEDSSIEQEIDTKFAYYRVLFEADIQRKIDQASSIQVKTQLTESNYQELKNRFAGVFEAGMGADAVHQLLQNIDLDELHAELLDQIRTTSGQRRVRAIKRLSVVEAFRTSGNKPEWMILTVLPVLPPELHPMVQLDGGRFATSDLNDLYRRVINRNNRLKHLLKLAAPDIIVRNERRMLQEAVDALIDNGRRGRAIMGRHNHKLKSLTDLLRGKQGRFRQNLLGKRVDYSGRSVIISGPKLKLHECGLPKQMALELFKPFVMNRLIAEGHAHNIKTAKRRAEEADAEVWDTLEKVVEGHPVLLNRAPTLHRLGIQAFYPRLVEGSAIQLHPLVCTAFNADFDGDQMAVHVPLSPGSINEAKQLMLSTKNMLAPRSGAPIVSPTLDMLLGIYYLTGKDTLLKARVTADELAASAEKYSSAVEEAWQENFDSAESEIQSLVKSRVDGQQSRSSAVSDAVKSGFESELSPVIGALEDLEGELGSLSRDVASHRLNEVIAAVENHCEAIETAIENLVIPSVGKANDALSEAFNAQYSYAYERTLASAAEALESAGVDISQGAFNGLRRSIEAISNTQLSNAISGELIDDLKRSVASALGEIRERLPDESEQSIRSFGEKVASEREKIVADSTGLVSDRLSGLVESATKSETDSLGDGLETVTEELRQIESLKASIAPDFSETLDAALTRVRNGNGILMGSHNDRRRLMSALETTLPTELSTALSSVFDTSGSAGTAGDSIGVSIDDAVEAFSRTVANVDWAEFNTQPNTESLYSADVQLSNASKAFDSAGSDKAEVDASALDAVVTELNSNIEESIQGAASAFGSAVDSAKQANDSQLDDDSIAELASELEQIVEGVIEDLSGMSESDASVDLAPAIGQIKASVDALEDDSVAALAGVDIASLALSQISLIGETVTSEVSKACDAFESVLKANAEDAGGNASNVSAAGANEISRLWQGRWEAVAADQRSALEELIRSDIEGTPAWNELDQSSIFSSEVHMYGSKDQAHHALDVGEVHLNDPIWLRMDGGTDVLVMEAEDSSPWQFTVPEPNSWIATTVGRVIFNEIFPPELGFHNYVMHEDEVEAIVHRCFEQLGNEGTAAVLDEMKRLGFEYAMASGTTIAIKDAVPPPEKSALLSEGRAQVRMLEQQYADGLITEEEKYAATIDTWNTTSDRVTAAVQSHLKEYNGVFAMADSGAKGNLAQIKQMAGMRGLMSNPRGRIIDSPIEASFSEGLSVHEFFTSTHGSRKALADTALKTAEAGYLTRRMADAAQDVIINAQDCGATVGMEITAASSRSLNLPLEERLFSRYPVNEVVHPETGEVLATVDHLIGVVSAKSIVAAGIEELEVRSPVSCTLERGVCAKCYGSMLADNRASIVGEAVGIVAAQSIGEPGTQLTMRNFHTGGIASDRDITTGLPRVQELFEARTPKVAAILSDISGTVNFREVGGQHIIAVESEELFKDEVGVKAGYRSSVKVGDWVDAGSPVMKLSVRGRKDASASDGTLSLPEEIVAEVSGTIAEVGDKVVIEWTERDEREYLPQGHVEILASDGDVVEPGSQLTDGQKNPHEILRITGIEAVQKYLVEEAQRVYRSQGVKVHDKHFEVIVRQMLRKVKIDSSGDSTLLINEIVDRSIYLHENEELRSKGGEPATASPVLLGISKVSLMSQSFLAKASFQETERVLTEAALQGSVDHLNGLKENVIIGRMIPARLDRTQKGREILGLPEPGEVKEGGEEIRVWEEVLAAIARGDDTGYGVPTNYTVPIDMLDRDGPARMTDIGFSDYDGPSADVEDDVLSLADSLLSNGDTSSETFVSFDDE